MDVECLECKKPFKTKGVIEAPDPKGNTERVQVDHGMMPGGFTCCPHCFGLMVVTPEKTWKSLTTDEFTMLAPDLRRMLQKIQDYLKGRTDGFKEFRSGKLSMFEHTGDAPNPAQQKAAASFVAAKVISKLIENTDDDDEFASKALKALSSIVEENSEHQDTFEEKVAALVSSGFVMMAITCRGDREEALAVCEKLLKKTEEDAKEADVHVLDVGDQIPNEKPN